MTDKKAKFLIDQLNPVIKNSFGVVRRLSIDYDNQDITFKNAFGAILERVYYADRDTLKVLKDVVDNLF